MTIISIEFRGDEADAFDAVLVLKDLLGVDRQGLNAAAIVRVSSRLVHSRLGAERDTG